MQHQEPEGRQSGWWSRAAGKVQSRLGLYGVLVLALGVLLWSRLLLVTRPPRVAIAEPNNLLVQPPLDTDLTAPKSQDPRQDLQQRTTTEVLP